MVCSNKGLIKLTHVQASVLFKLQTVIYSISFGRSTWGFTYTSNESNETNTKL